MKGQADLFSISGARFSPCRLYRYSLWRIWDESKKPLLFIGLNPSTADEDTNDPTVERMERRAKTMGFGGLVVCNIFAFRATDPRDMMASTEPIGEPWNDAAIIAQAKRAGMIVCGWGIHGTYKGRGIQVATMLERAGIKMHCLGLTRDGQPRHPLYIKYEVEAVPYATIT